MFYRPEKCAAQHFYGKAAKRNRTAVSLVIHGLKKA